MPDLLEIPSSPSSPVPYRIVRIFSQGLHCIALSPFLGWIAERVKSFRDKFRSGTLCCLGVGGLYLDQLSSSVFRNQKRKIIL